MGRPVPVTNVGTNKFGLPHLQDSGLVVVLLLLLPRLVMASPGAMVPSLVWVAVSLGVPLLHHVPAWVLLGVLLPSLDLAQVPLGMLPPSLVPSLVQIGVLLLDPFSVVVLMGVLVLGLGMAVVLLGTQWVRSMTVQLVTHNLKI